MELKKGEEKKSIETEKQLKWAALLLLMYHKYCWYNVDYFQIYKIINILKYIKIKENSNLKLSQIPISHFKILKIPILQNL